MTYAISFLEGIITFVSPCLLPLLPLYASYFAGGDKSGKGHTLRNALGFILGFTIIFLILGAFAGTVGRLLSEYQLVVNWVTGGIVILFGLHYVGVLPTRFLRGARASKTDVHNLGFFSSVLFGITFSVSWTPCVGAFLGSALMLASQQGSVGKGMLMLLCYALGLGLPLLISALLIERLKSAFQFIKRHYKAINLVSGGLLVLLGLLMATGLMGKMLGFLSV